LFDDTEAESGEAVEASDAAGKASGDNLFDDESSAVPKPVETVPPAPPAADEKPSDFFGDEPAPGTEPAPTDEPAPSDEPAAGVDEAKDEAPPAAPSEPAPSDDPFGESEDPAPAAPSDAPAPPAADDLFETPASDPVPAFDAAAPSDPQPASQPSGEDDFTTVDEPRRRWIHSSGATSLVATLVDVAADGSCILDTQGQRLRVPLENLSQHDRDYVGAAAVRIAARRDAKEQEIKSQAVTGPGSNETAGL
jgi:hypothetical protein